MKYILILSFVTITAQGIIFGADRIQKMNNQQVMPASTNMNQNQSQFDTDPNLFPYFIAVLGNFSKILLDPQDTPKVTQHVANIIDSIISIAYEATRGNVPNETRARLITTFCREIQRNPRMLRAFFAKPC